MKQFVHHPRAWPVIARTHAEIVLGGWERLPCQEFLSPTESVTHFVSHRIHLVYTQRRHGAELAALDDVRRDVFAELVAVDHRVDLVAPAIEVGVLAASAEAGAAETPLLVRLGDAVRIKILELESGHRILLRSSAISS